MFGVDAVDAAKTLIAEGKMTGTIKQDAVGMAEAVAVITDNLIKGEDKFAGLAENVVIVDDWFVQIPYAVYTGEEYSAHNLRSQAATGPRGTPFPRAGFQGKPGEWDRSVFSKCLNRTENTLWGIHSAGLP